MRPIAVLPLALLALLVPAGCDRSEEKFNANPAPAEDPDALRLQAEIADLRHGGQPGDPTASAAYDKAVNALLLRGAKIETRMIDTLRSHPDPWVRYGCAEVLGTIATKAGIEHLIAVLDDEEAMVAFIANQGRQTLTGQRIIPPAGQPARDGVPPVPPRPAADLALDAEERAWRSWHAANKAAFKAAWERWWSANRATAQLK
jgi:HEAT repeat protein